MKDAEYQDQLTHYRQKYKEAESPDEKAEIKRLAETFKHAHGCYECQEHAREEDVDKPLFCFCSEKCMKIWQDKNYHDNQKLNDLGRPMYSIPEIQLKLKQMAQEARQKRII